MHAGDQKTREQAHDERTEAGTHPKQIAEFTMQSETGKDVTKKDFLGEFQIVMFGDSVTNHALQGLHKLQEITIEQGEGHHTRLACVVSGAQGSDMTHSLY